MVGETLSGAAQGFGSFLGASAEAEALKESTQMQTEADIAAEQRQAANFATQGFGIVGPDDVPARTARPLPTDAFSRSVQTRSFAWNPVTGRIEAA